jgi:hypothetical protein
MTASVWWTSSTFATAAKPTNEGDGAVSFDLRETTSTTEGLDVVQTAPHDGERRTGSVADIVKSATAPQHHNALEPAIDWVTRELAPLRVKEFERSSPLCSLSESSRTRTTRRSRPVFTRSSPTSPSMPPASHCRRWAGGWRNLRNAYGPVRSISNVARDRWTILWSVTALTRWLITSSAGRRR